MRYGLLIVTFIFVLGCAKKTFNGFELPDNPRTIDFDLKATVNMVEARGPV